LRKIILQLLLSAWSFAAFALSNNHLTHYSVEDGLPQNRASGIYQDKKGFIWIPTHNGLAKFDGENFTTYLNTLSEEIQIIDSRLEQIKEDRFGNIWIKSHKGLVYRLNTLTDSIDLISSRIDLSFPGFKTTRIRTSSSGAVWLQSDRMGCVCFDDSLLSHEYYGTKNRKLTNDTIKLIHEDDDGNTWIITADNLFMEKRIDRKTPIALKCTKNIQGNFNTLTEFKNQILLGTQSGLILSYCKSNGQTDTLGFHTSRPIENIKKYKKNKLLIGTADDGFYIYDLKTRSANHFNSGNSGLQNNHVLSFHIDPQGDVWIQTQISGIARYDQLKKSITQYHSPVSNINKHLGATLLFRTDKKNNTFIRPRDGILSYYDPHSKELIPFNKSKFSPSPDYTTDIYNFYFDRQNNLWISPINKGIDKITFSDNCFQIRKFDTNTNSAENNIRAILIDSERNTWISSRDGKIRILDQKNKLKGYLCTNGTIGFGTPVAGVAYCLYQDKKQNIWIGTRGSGLYLITPHGKRYQIRHYTNNPDDIYSLGNDNIYSIKPDNRGRIWIGTWGNGLNLCDFSKDGSIRFINHRNRLKNYPVNKAKFIRYISEEKNGKIYVASNNGLVVFDSNFQSESKINFHYYGQGDPREGSLSQGDIQHICHASNGTTYLSTGSGGINFVKEWTQNGYPKSFGLITKNNGLGSNYILSIVEDSLQILWVISENCITRYNPQQNSFRVFPFNKITESGNYSEGSTILSKSNIILQGSSEGLLSFEPLKITSDSYNPQIVFTKFRLFNHIVQIGSTKHYKQNIDNINRLILIPKNKVFSIEFSALDFMGPRNIHYKYKLDGFDEEWRFSGTHAQATYTSLPKGKYLLRVKSTNASGAWVNNERQLSIEMLPTFWQSGWGHLVIVLGAVFLIVGGAYILFTIYRLRHQIRVEAHLAELKLRFFTDISHEIRTPLTLISGPVEHLLSLKSTPEPIKKQLNIVRVNTQRTLRMVNQILDFRRAQHGRLKIEQFAPGGFVKSICKNFVPLAKEKHIYMTVEDSTHGKFIWADKNGFEKILFNLLTNALKYTPKGRNIDIKVAHNINGFTLQVSDQGIGIDAKNLPHIFDRFYTVKSSKSLPSSGIGLAMVKELVDKHKGQISVKSVLHEGTTFTVLFKDGYSHFDKQFDLIIQTNPNIAASIQEKHYPEPTPPFNAVSNKPTILVVEDNPDLKHFIFSILATDYQVVLAANGKEAYNMALMHIPDFIVSDLMMPEMDGMELLKALRSNINTSHIPFILLTAKDNIEDKIKGMDIGADDYIVKPFSIRYFQSRIQNLLTQRKNLQYRYSSELNSSFSKYEKLKGTGMLELDQDFLDSIVREIEVHLDDSDYSIEKLAKTTGVNRTAFFKKIKSLTGFSPIELIRDIRIQNAARLLRNEHLLVKEICYRVGFADQKYFTRCFKSKYNLTPTQYRLINRTET